MELGDQIQKLLNQGIVDCSEPPSSLVISKAAKHMSEVNQQAFEPQLVSIGPYYLHDESLRPMLKHKLRFFRRLSGQLYGSKDIKNDITKAAEKLVDDARKCYSDTFDVSDLDFALMIALDGCFIIELFRYDLKRNKGVDVDDPIFGTPWMLPKLRLDLIKLGNQLPFYVIQALYDLTSSREEPSLTEISANFFAPLLQAGSSKPAAPPVVQIGTRHAHLLGLYHSTFYPMRNQASVSIADTSLLENSNGRVDRATELWFLGIRFQKGKGDLLDINFCKKKMLEIPLLSMDHNFYHVLLNFVAYEQCHQRLPSYFTYYTAFLICLVTSNEDVELLRYSGIIDNSLVTNEDVIVRLNSLAKLVQCDGHDCYLSSTIGSIHNIKSKRWNRFKTTIRDYFNRQWSGITVFAIYLSIIQTVFAYLSYQVSVNSS